MLALLACANGEEGSAAAPLLCRVTVTLLERGFRKPPPPPPPPPLELLKLPLCDLEEKEEVRLCKNKLNAVLFFHCTLPKKNEHEV